MLVVSLPSRFPLRFLTALALGVLHAAAFIDDATWPIAIAALAGLAALAARAARDTTSWRAAFAGARAGFAFGIGWFVTGISWIYVSLHIYGEMAAPVAAAGTFLLAAYLALYPALACAAYAACRRRFALESAASSIASTAVFASLWALSEIGRGYLLTGFPWLATGYAQVAGPLAGYAPWVGVYGVCLAAAFVAAALTAAAGGLGRREKPRTWVTFLFVAGVPLAGVGLSRIDWSVPVGPPLSMRLLQGNIAQDIKFDEARFGETAEVYLKLIEAKSADLIVLPETAFPQFLEDLPDRITERLLRDAHAAHAAIAFGVPIAEGRGRYFNSVIAIVPGRSAEPPSGVAGRDATQRYDKAHIVPFGEFIPFGFRWFVDLMKMPLGDFTRGAIDQKPMLLAGNKVAFNVCYEDLFGEEIIRQARDANILINVSNVAWFGDSMALPQHLAISRMRAIETARPMLRATNTGMTAAIDPHGRVTGRLAPFTTGSLDVTVQGMSGATPYDRFGNAPILILVALVLSGVIATTRRRRGGRADHQNGGIRTIDLS